MVVLHKRSHTQVVEREASRGHTRSLTSVAVNHAQDKGIGDFGCIYATSGRKGEQGREGEPLDTATLGKLKKACGAMKLSGHGGEMARRLKFVTHWQMYPNVNVPPSPSIKQLDSKDSFPLLSILASSLSQDSVAHSSSKSESATTMKNSKPTTMEGGAGKGGHDSSATIKCISKLSTAAAAVPMQSQHSATPPSIMDRVPSLSRTSTATSASSSIPVTPVGPLTPSIPGITASTSKPRPVPPPTLRISPPAPSIPEPFVFYATKPVTTKSPSTLPPTLAPSSSQPLSLKAQQSLAQSHIDAVLASCDETQMHIDSVIRKYETRRQEGMVRLMASRGEPPMM
ncbi:hypothetical protein OE88DRAFT_1655466 [Heliocybe sulcata]|uniref:Uncharacterized protein n=1 Tax=Heliocybe sulcata TaxID=5364 RepID=A0A5C3N6M8_9AGAM|nr:hypothetical protein OE88DRAFT_1655466 [Heliocybe sulcata]